MSNYILTENKIFNLPYHLRVGHCKGFDYIHEVWGDHSKEVEELIKNRSLTLTDILKNLNAWYPSVVGSVLQNEFEDRFNISSEVAAMLFVSERFNQWRGHHFQTTDSLDNILNKSMVGDSCTAEMLRLPYPAMYIEFGDLDSSIYKINHPSTGDHKLEAAYIFEIKQNSIRTLDIILVGKPKDHALDDAIDTIFLRVENENMQVSNLLQKMIATTREIKPNVMTPDNIQNMKNAMNHIAMSILYINLKCAKKQNNFALTDALKRIKNLGPKKKARELRKAQYMYDKVILGPEKNHTSLTVNKGLSGNQKSPHWRRGHFRQAHNKLTFIEPMVIRADLLDSEPMQKNYVVK